jgi:hypothetical protein
MPFDVLGFGFSCTLAGLSPAGVTRLARGACRGGAPAAAWLHATAASLGVGQGLPCGL